MLPLLIFPIALVFGLATHDAPPATHAPTSSAVVDTSHTPNPTVTVRFRNDATDLATVYAVADQGYPVRLGQVTPGGTERFTLPRSLVGSSASLQIIAVPFARNFYAGSGPIGVSAGDVIDANLSSQENAVWVLPGR